jgi:hypothetical protein
VLRRIARLSLVCLVGSVALLLRGTAAAAQTTPTRPLPKAKAVPALRSGSSTDIRPAETPRVQSIVDDLRARLFIPQEVVVSIVAQDKLLVSIERSQDREGVFALAFERDFLEVLGEDELTAVVAHELGHVWIFTHHPFLQTEELANQVALRLVSRDTLDRVYEKVWQRTGSRGDLAYLPAK